MDTQFFQLFYGLISFTLSSHSPNWGVGLRVLSPLSEDHGYASNAFQNPNMTSYQQFCVIQDWDALIVISTQDVKVQSHGDSFTFRQTESKGEDSTEKRRKPDLEEGSISDSFEIEIITGFNMAGFEQAARLLLRRLGLAKKDDIKPRLGKLLRLWRALQIYQQYRKQTRWSSVLMRISGISHGHSEINDNVDYYINLLNWTSSEPNESLNEEDDTEEDDAGEDDAHSKHLSALKGTKMKIHYPDAPYRENEVPVGATAEEHAVSAKDIAIMLAFTEHVGGDRYKGINPLILRSLSGQSMVTVPSG
ncbi:hypothetical protein BDD12DRAFT_809620 [Trichophaea hybrida]|nr:hypothetical protein BDD12DRAFT_809620 [Trichophaea hybrida]